MSPTRLRRSHPGQSERQTLRAIVVRAEGVVERAFGEPRQRRRPERQRVDEAVAPEHRQRLRELVVDANVELVLARVGHRGRCVDRRAGDIRVRNQRDDRRADRIPAIAGNHPLPLRVSTELRPPGGKWIHDGAAEETGLLRRRRYLAHARDTFEIAQAFVVREPEGPVPRDRTAGRSAELIALPLGLWARRAHSRRSCWRRAGRCGGTRTRCRECYSCPI